MSTASFRIEIIPKPIYVGGTGPPMAPITAQPEHDEESWVIAQLIDYDKVPHYVVHPKDKPMVRKIVEKIDILDWVSPRVYEDFEYHEAKRRDAREEEVKKEKELRRLAKNGKKRGRPFKYVQPGASAPLVESIETETDTPDDGADNLASSRLPQPSNIQPSLSIPSLSQPHLTLRHTMNSPFDTEVPTEDDGPSASMEPPRKRSRTSTSTGLPSKTPRTPPEPLSGPQTVQARSQTQNPDAPTSKQPPRSKSTAEPSTPLRTSSSPSKNQRAASSETRSLRDRSAQPFYGRQRSQTSVPPHSASPAKSRKSITPAARYGTRSSSRSRNATPSDSIAKFTSTPKGSKSASPKPSSTSTPRKRSKSATPSKSKPAREEEEVDENKVDKTKRWKVLRLLDDRYRMIKHRRCHYYLTQWAGDYEPTWEQATNITSDLKVEYEAWKNSKEGRAYKGERKKRVEMDDVGEGSEERLPSDSSDDDQALASRQLGSDINNLPIPEDSDSAEAEEVDLLSTDTPSAAVKREMREESISDLPLARSPYFPDLYAEEEESGSGEESSSSSPSP